MPGQNRQCSIRERRLKALQFLQNESGEVKVPFVYAETGANAADLALLAEHDFIEFSEVEIQRDPLVTHQPGEHQTTAAHRGTSVSG